MTQPHPSKIEVLSNFVKSHPPNVILGKVLEKVLRMKLANAQAVRKEISGRSGIEIGGPSRLFEDRGYCPAYPFASRVDTVNFSSSTIWEGDIKDGQAFQFATGRNGKQWISEATDLSRIGPGEYDFLISSNCIEHVANPLRALREWHRIVKNGGFLLIVAPSPRSNFDHRRPLTPFEHLVEDFKQGTEERDLTHLPEILELHDLKRDPEARSFEEFKARGEANFTNRCLHHHVFSLISLRKMVEFVGFEFLFQEASSTNLFVAARRI